MDNKKQNGVKLQGVVQKCLSNGMFRIKLENGFQVLAYLSGKIRINFIRILLGDHVIVEMSPYDLSKGRILYRLQRKKNNFKPKKKNNFKPKKKNNFKPKKKK